MLASLHYSILFGAAFLIALGGSIAGISGAFLLLPLQIGILGQATPNVSATNQLFNIIATPGGIWKFWKEGRMLLPLAIFMAAGTLPGVFIGALLRATLLRQANRFMLFAACVLIYTGFRLLLGKKGKKGGRPAGKCNVTRFSRHGFAFEYNGSVFNADFWPVMLLSLVIGLIGGTYGVGGGGMIAPFLVSFFGLPVHTIAGACLFVTFLTSVLGVLFYCMMAMFLPGVPLVPDWGLGLLLGSAGALGVYAGASLQKYFPAHILKVLLGILQLCIGGIFAFQGFKALF